MSYNLRESDNLCAVEVVIRVRPVLSNDRGISPEGAAIAAVCSGHSLTVIDTDGWSGAGEERKFSADAVLDSNASNLDIFNHVLLPQIDRAVSSVPETLCFLAYGHTNSGKTHTIGGGYVDSFAKEGIMGQEEPGLLTLCVQELLKKEGVVEVAMLEVYMESIYDLLSYGAQRRIRRRRSPTTGETYVVVEDLKTCIVTNLDQWNSIANYGMKSRRTTATERNERSSRSHALYTVKSPSVGLCFVDLAGSERQTTFSPQLNKESVAINNSLSSLSTVLQALSEQHPREGGRKPYVNFRDSTLTVLLQRYLTGSSRTTFLACIHPVAQYCSETISTLRYTERIRRIRTAVPHANESSSHNSNGMLLYDKETSENRLLEEVAQLRRQVASHEAEKSLLAQYQGRISELEAKVEKEAQFSSAVSNRCAESICTTEEHFAGKQALQNRCTTKRLTQWLLGRLLRDLPPLNIYFDGYFDAMLPVTVQVIGYVSTMMCLPPLSKPSSHATAVHHHEQVEDKESELEQVAFIAVDDISMGLSMLDSGIPPWVPLHRPRCAGERTWGEHKGFSCYNSPMAPSCEKREESIDLSGLFLVFFHISEATIVSIDKYLHRLAGSEEISQYSSSLDHQRCCDMCASSEPLIPLAVVCCVPSNAPLFVKEDALQRLALLVQQYSVSSPQRTSESASPAATYNTGNGTCDLSESIADEVEPLVFDSKRQKTSLSPLSNIEVAIKTKERCESLSPSPSPAPVKSAKTLISSLSPAPRTCFRTNVVEVQSSPMTSVPCTIIAESNSSDEKVSVSLENASPAFEVVIPVYMDQPVTPTKVCVSPKPLERQKVSAVDEILCESCAMLPNIGLACISSSSCPLSFDAPDPLPHKPQMEENSSGIVLCNDEKESPHRFWDPELHKKDSPIAYHTLSPNEFSSPPEGESGAILDSQFSLPSHSSLKTHRRRRKKIHSMKEMVFELDSTPLMAPKQVEDCEALPPAILPVSKDGEQQIPFVRTPLSDELHDAQRKERATQHFSSYEYSEDQAESRGKCQGCFVM